MSYVLAGVLFSIVVIVVIFATVWFFQSKDPAQIVVHQSPAKAPTRAITNTIGIPYHSSNSGVNAIMGDLQVLLTQIIYESCNNSDVKKSYNDTKAQYIAEMKNKGNISCDQAKAMLATIVANLYLNHFDSANAQTFRTNLTTLYTHAIDAVCVNNIVDPTKLEQLLDDMNSSICL